MSVTAGETLGLILAGGAGRRCRGQDKAWVRLHGRPLICHALALLTPQVDRIVIASSRHGWAYRRLGLVVQPDHEPWRGCGPMAAIATVLRARPTGRVALLPVDAPRAPSDYVARLHPALDAGAPAAAVFDGARRQPLFALIATSVADSAIEAMTAAAPPSVQSWLDSLGAVWVPVAAAVDDYANINTQEELRRLHGLPDPKQ